MSRFVVLVRRQRPAFRAGSRACRQPAALEGLASGRRFSALPDLHSFVSASLEEVAEQGRVIVNTALAASGSFHNFKGAASFAQPAQTEATSGSQFRKCFFWAPLTDGSPFEMGREAFIAKHLFTSEDSSNLVPDSDVERYVDFLLSECVLANVSLPAAVGRKLYIRIVRMVLRVIINAFSMVDGVETMGKKLVLLKKPSDITGFGPTEAEPVDMRVVRRLAKRTVDDHKVSSPYLIEMGIPMPLVLRLYEDVIALVMRLVIDIIFTFEIRCLGHSLTCKITADSMLHNAPGWDIEIERGAFGLFADAEKRRWARSFVQELLEDKAVRIPELPGTLQEHIYTRAVLVLLNLSETALNHGRIHVAGMAFHPALMRTS